MLFYLLMETLKVMADVSVEVVEEQFTERYYWTNPELGLRAELGMKTICLM